MMPRPSYPALRVLGGLHHVGHAHAGRLVDFLNAKKYTPPITPRWSARNSELSGGTFVQPLPTLKESEGSNSSERYSPGCKALSSSGRGRGLDSFSVPPQAASATTTSAASITSPKARLTVLLRGCIRRSSSPYATGVAYSYEVEQRIPQMQYLLRVRV